MSKRVQFIRQNATDSASFTGLEGELSVNLDSDNLIVHDGAKQGGFPVARFDLINSPVASAANDGKMSKEQVQELNTASGVVQSLDKQIGGYLTKSISGSVGLTDAEADNLFIEFTGTLAADAIIQFPNNAAIHYVSNRTNGGFNVVCEIVGSSRQIIVKSGETAYFIADNSSPTKEFTPVRSDYGSRNLRRGLDLNVLGGVSNFVTMTRGSIIDDTGSFQITIDQVLNIDITVSGANGIDVLPLIGDAGYYVYAIGDSSGVNPGAGLISTNFLTPVMPAGYDKKAIVGFVYSDLSTQLMQVSNTGYRYRFAESVPVVSQDDGINPPLQGFATMSLAIPGGLLESYQLIAYMELADTASGFVQLKVADANLGVPAIVGIPDLEIRSIPGVGSSAQIVIEMSAGNTLGDQIYWKLSSTSTGLTMRLSVSGFVLKSTIDYELLLP